MDTAGQGAKKAIIMARRTTTSADTASNLRRQLRTLTDALTGSRLVKLRDARRAFERDYVKYAITKLGDRASAARSLGIGLSTLKEKIRTPRASARR